METRLELWRCQSTMTQNYVTYSNSLLYYYMMMVSTYYFTSCWIYMAWTGSGLWFSFSLLFRCPYKLQCPHDNENTFTTTVLIWSCITFDTFTSCQLHTLLQWKSHMILVAMETILVRHYEFLSYQSVCTYKKAWCRFETIVQC